MKWSLIIGIIVIVAVGGFLLFRNANQFDLPEGETTPFVDVPEEDGGEENSDFVKQENNSNMVSMSVDNKTVETTLQRGESTREVLVTDGVKHSIPLDDILSGGPPKDGIPSIDSPEFITTTEADSWLDGDEPGLGVEINGEVRFYPYQILVWHEIVNDTLAGEPLLVTYCPLCRTGIVFERRVEGEVQEFGVSGRLWQSNLLMYNRAGNPDTESLWSQVLGEAVLGPETGERLAIVPSDTVRYGGWKEKHPDTVVLSRDTGTLRPYGGDPYGDYYTDNSAVSFGATFNDDRLPAKAFVLGVEIGEQFKAYHDGALPEGTTTDTFAGRTITIEKDNVGAVRMFVGDNELPYIGGFWFSWVAVHPDTALFK